MSVGHPLNMDGSKGPRAQLCEEFAQQLGELVSVPVVLWGRAADDRFSDWVFE